LNVGRDAHTGQTQGSGSSENRCSKTWNSFHELISYPPKLRRKLKTQAFLPGSFLAI
jgi:hypothetical protein